MACVDRDSRLADAKIPRTPAMRRAVLATILLVSLVANSIGIGFAQPRHYDQSVDAIPPVLSLDAFHNAFGERSRVGIKYPPLHFVLTGAVQHLWLRTEYGAAESEKIERDILEVLAARTSGSREVTHDSWREWSEPIGGMIVAGRCVSAVMGTLLVLGLFWFARALFGFTVGAIAAALAAVSYPIVFYAHTLNVDVPYLCWGVLALHGGARAVQTGSARWLAVCGVFAALAAATKDQAYGWFLVTGPLLLWFMARPGRLAATPERSFPLGGVLVATAVTAAVYLVMLGLVFDREAVALHFEHIFGEGVAPYRSHENTLSGHAGLFVENFDRLLDGLGAPVLILSVLGILVALRRDARCALLVLTPAVSYYASFLAPIGYTNLRFTIPIQLMLLIAAAVALGSMLTSARLRWVGMGFLVVSLGQGVWRTVDLDRMMLREPAPGRAHLHGGELRGRCTCNSVRDVGLPRRPSASCAGRHAIESKAYDPRGLR